MDETGALVIEDLGSTNGIGTAGPERVLRATVVPGLEVRLGRTVLRFRDSAEPVPPALVDAPSRTGTAFPAWWPHSSRARLAVAAAAIGATVAYTWLNGYERTTISGLLIDAVGIGVLFALWAGAWSLGSRIVIQRFNFLPHLAIASLGGLAGILLTVASEWSEFLFPDNTLLSTLQGAAGFGLVMALIAAHLSYASHRPAAYRWRAGAVASGVLLAFTGLAVLGEDEFGQADFSAVLKPVPAALVVTTDGNGFLREVEELKEEVDRDLDAGSQE